MLYLISRSFAFQGIEHPALTPFLRYAPLVPMIVFTLLYWVMPVRPALTGDGSLSRHMITVFAILPGFFIVALVAVSTFHRPEIDEVMPDPAPRLKLRTGQHESYVSLTTRMFITHLFSYLASISFFAVFLFICADISSPSISHLVSLISDKSWQDMLTRVFALLYFACVIWLTAKTVLTTLVGLYFLAERIHRPSA